MSQTATSLPSEIEGVESEAWLDLFAAAPTAYAASSEVSYKRFVEAGALAHRTIPMTEFNRLIIGGARGLWNESKFRNAIDWLEQHAASNWAVQIAPVTEPPHVSQWATSNGLEPSGIGWAKWYQLARNVDPPDVTSNIEIIAVTKNLDYQFGNLVQRGFGLPAPAALWFTALVGRPGWHIYLAFSEGRAVAAATMFIKNQWAWLGVDTTLEDARGRGAQSSLIARRLSDGLAAGVVGFTAETASLPPEDGAGYSSFRNYRRSGFALAYIRRNYKRL